MNDCNIQQEKPANPREGGESDSQAFNIIIFKCPLSIKITDAHKEKENMVHSKKKETHFGLTR